MKEEQDFFSHNISDPDKALELIMNKYQERLYWRIRNMVSNHEDANDILQNTFIKVYRSLKTFKGDSKMYTWLYRIATNETITFINKKKRKISGISIHNEDLNISNELHSEVYIDENETLNKLKKAMVALPPKQKKVFELRYFQELTYREMSEMLDTSEGSLKASYHHAIKKIEDFLINN